MLPPTPFLRSSHTLSFPSLPHVVPPYSQLRPPTASLLSGGVSSRLSCWKCCQRMFLCAACQVPGESAWKCSAGGAVGARENHCSPAAFSNGKTSLRGAELCVTAEVAPSPFPLPQNFPSLMQRRRGCSTTTENGDVFFNLPPAYLCCLDREV